MFFKKIYSDIYPYLIYHSLPLDDTRKYCFSKLEQNRGYLLRKAIVKHVGIGTIHGNYANTTPNIEFSGFSRDIRRQSQAIPAQNYSPFFVDWDPIAGTVNNRTALNGIKYVKNLNYLFDVNDSINIEITGTLAVNANTIDILLFGYSIPAKYIGKARP